MRVLWLGLLTAGLLSILASPQTAVYRVVIDPTHGGDDTGAIGLYEIIEKQLVLQIAHLIAIEAAAALAIKVMLTRSDDRYLSREERFQIAQTADLFINLHADFSYDSRVRGITAFVSTRADVRSQALAETLRKYLVTSTKAPDLGTKTAPLWLRRLKIPAVQINLGFVTNPDEARKLMQLSYQMQLARAILDSIQEFTRVR